MGERVPPSIEDLIDQVSGLSLGDVEPIPPEGGFPGDLQARPCDQDAGTPGPSATPPTAREEPGPFRRRRERMRRRRRMFKNARQGAAAQGIRQVAQLLAARYAGPCHQRLAKGRAANGRSDPEMVSREPRRRRGRPTGARPPGCATSTPEHQGRVPDERHHAATLEQKPYLGAESPVMST